MISDEILGRKVEKLCRDTAMLRKIKSAIRKGVEEQYPKICQLYSRKQVLSDEFSTVFSDFYGIRRFAGLFRYDELLKMIACGKELPIDDVIRKISISRMEFSFATKALHTVNNDLPIFDSRIQTFFNIVIPGKGEAKIAAEAGIYEELKRRFQNRDQNGLSALAEVFDRMYPGTAFSAVKKIDFIIWGLGKKE